MHVGIVLYLAVILFCSFTQQYSFPSASPFYFTLHGIFLYQKQQLKLGIADHKTKMAGGESGRPFEFTPTWVVAVVCFVIVSISLFAERALHKLGRVLQHFLFITRNLHKLLHNSVLSWLFNQCFKRKKQDAMFEALQKLKEGLIHNYIYVRLD